MKYLLILLVCCGCVSCSKSPSYEEIRARVREADKKWGDYVFTNRYKVTIHEDRRVEKAADRYDTILKLYQFDHVSIQVLENAMLDYVELVNRSIQQPVP